VSVGALQLFVTARVLLDVKTKKRIAKIAAHQGIGELFLRSLGEETANAVLHGVGAALAIAGLVLLIFRALGGDVKTLVSFILFAATMFVMFTASTLYHGVQSVVPKRLLKILDHQAIYLFIAGSYTPVCLLTLPPRLGWIIFALEWGCALSGILLYALRIPFLKKVELIVYLVMGWAVVVCIPYLRAGMSTPTLIFLGLGGICYTLGVFWYVRKRTHGAHIVWHVFVLAGAVCHWWSVWFMG
jgi:hemolysin III